MSSRLRPYRRTKDHTHRPDNFTNDIVTDAYVGRFCHATNITMASCKFMRYYPGEDKHDPKIGEEDYKINLAANKVNSRNKNIKRFCF